MNQDLALKRCANHWQREAAARCPDCKRFFCRECVTEHQDRLLCASCLRKTARTEEKRFAASLYVLRFAQIFVGILLLWIFFYYIGQALLLMPEEFHEGTLWQES